MIEKALNNTLKGLNELSDSNIQKELWIEGIGGISSFTEAICSIFDDSGLAVLMNENGLKDPLLSKFNELDSLLRQIPEHDAPENIINHPNMKDVKRVSNELIQLINISQR